MKYAEVQYIGIAGLIASGKSTVAEYFSTVHGYSRLSFGRMISQRLENDGVLVDRFALQKEGAAVIEAVGYQGIAELLLSTKDGNLYQTIEGIRHSDVATFFRDKFGTKFILLFIDCPYELRFERARRREPRLTREMFDAQASAPIEIPTLQLKELADDVINNTGDVVSLREQLKQLVCS